MAEERQIELEIHHYQNFKKHVKETTAKSKGHERYFKRKQMRMERKKKEGKSSRSN